MTVMSKVDGNEEWRKVAKHYHLPKCCQVFSDQDQDIEMAIRESSYPQIVQDSLRTMLQGVVFGPLREEQEIVLSSDDDEPSICSSKKEVMKEKQRSKGKKNKDAVEEESEDESSDTESANNDGGEDSSTSCDDSISVQHKHTFPVGYKFYKRFNDGRGGVKVVKAEISQMGNKRGDRIISYPDDDSIETELMHVADLDSVKSYHSSSSGRHEYSLHAGDKIKYKPYMTEGRLIGTVLKISKSTYRNHRPDIEMSGGMDNQLAQDLNPDFTIIKTVHADAPPPGRWINLDDVNLVLGQVHSEEESVSSTEQGPDNILNRPGGEMVALAVAASAAEKRSRKSLEESKKQSDDKQGINEEEESKEEQEQEKELEQDESKDEKKNDVTRMVTRSQSGHTKKK